MDTFTRADNAVRANKASRQTADTFQASATFLELLAIWGPIEPELQQKIKFAKFHALRIAKALKAGEDPNLSNPKPEPAAEDLASPLDPNDPEVRALTGAAPKNRQPSVVEVPDEAHSLQARLAHQSIGNESMHPSRAPSAPPPNEANTPQGTSGGVSPLPKDAASFYANQQNTGSPVSPDRQSVGGNYFPRMPSPTSAQTQPNLPPTLPSAPDTLGDQSPTIDLPSAPLNPAGALSGPILPETPTTFATSQQILPKTPLDSFQAPPVAGPPPINSIPPDLPQTFAPPPNASQPPVPPSQPAAAPFSPPILTPAPLPQYPTQPVQPTVTRQPVATPVYQPPPPPASNVVLDEEAMMKAQKHARWAISALNFEDVPTAIKEFQAALQTLGAR